MKIKVNIIAIVVSSSILMSSCGTIISNSKYPVLIDSSPSESEFSITNKKGVEVYAGVTPTTVSLKPGGGYFRKARYTVTFKKEGYETKTMPITSKLNGWYFGNLIFCFPIGLLFVDPATGAMYRIKTKKVNANFEKVISLNESGKFGVLDINGIPEDLKKDLVLVQN